MDFIVSLSYLIYILIDNDRMKFIVEIHLCYLFLSINRILPINTWHSKSLAKDIFSKTRDLIIIFSKIQKLIFFGFKNADNGTINNEETGNGNNIL
jgi:hypothetical protein